MPNKRSSEYSANIVQWYLSALKDKTNKNEWTLITKAKIQISLGIHPVKIKRNDWLLADTCPQAANHYALFWVWEWTQVL